MAFWNCRGRGVFLTIMAVPLFLSIYFLIFLNLDSMSAESKSGFSPDSGGRSGRTFIKTIVKMQRGLDDLGIDLSNIISHQEYIQDRILTVINQTSFSPKYARITEELESILKKIHSQNYTSIFERSFLITCNQIETIQYVSKPKWRDAYSYTEYGLYGFKPVITVRSRTDVKDCEEAQKNAKTCRVYANNLAMRDIMLFHQLQHPGMAKLVGYCVQDMLSGVSYVIQNGKSLNITEVAVEPWKLRIQILIDLYQLVEYLYTSPIGRVYLDPLLPRSFILNERSRLKLWDTRTMKFGDTRCTKNQDCREKDKSNDIPCIGGVCQGLSLHQIIDRTKEQFLTPLLDEYPREHAADIKYLKRLIERNDIKINEIIRVLRTLGSDSEETELTAKPPYDKESDVKIRTSDSEENRIWSTGQDSYSYRKLVNTDLPGHHDYACPRSQVTWGCVITMPSRDAAFRRCSGDPQCRAFVIMPNTTTNGWPNICYKNGYQDIVDAPDSTLYIKVPIRDPEDDMKYGGEDTQYKEEGEFNIGNSISCVTSYIEKQYQVRSSREKRLMTFLGLPDISESEWSQAMQTLMWTEVDTSKVMFNQRGSSLLGGSLSLHLEKSLGDLDVIIKRGPTRFHDAHLLFYYVDRLLGVYLTPPTRQQTFPEEVVAKFNRDIPGFKDRFSTLVTQRLLSGILVASPPFKSTGVSRLSISPLPNITSSIRRFSSQQQNHLEYILLLWFTGTPRFINDMQSSKGLLLHLDSSDAFQQGVDSLIPYFYHCQFPLHVIEMLQMMRREQASSPTCSFSNQVFFKLQDDGIRPESLSLLFKGPQQLSKLLNRSMEMLLDIVDICVGRFGENSVLFD